MLLVGKTTERAVGLTLKDVALLVGEGQGARHLHRKL